MSNDPQSPSAEALEKLAEVQVGLRSDLDVVRQTGAGSEPRYVVHDPVQFSNHMFDAHEYRVLSAIEPTSTLSESFSRLVEDGVLGEDERSSFFQFVLLQHQRGLLRLPLSDANRTWQRAKRERAQEREVAPLRRLLYWRVPVWNPDRFLRATLPIAAWAFTLPGLALWFVLMTVAGWISGDAFFSLLFDAPTLLEPGNLPLMWSALVGLKIAHELGHAYACRRFGGPVPEMGLAFILAAPCAYVDASAAWRFEKRKHRIAVSMAGMYVESFIAGIALLVWAGTEDGLVRAAAHNVVVLATAMTVLFNINPLMRFDGYYLLSDFIHEPNLRARSAQELSRIGKQMVGVEAGPRSSRWLLHRSYGVGAFCYKIILALGIVRIVMFEWPLVGAGFAAAFSWMLLGQPLMQGLRWLWTSEATEPVRGRARVTAVAMCTVIPVLAAIVIPVGLSVELPAVVVSTDEEQVVRAPEAGFLREVCSKPGTKVQEGDVLAVVESPSLDVDLQAALAQHELARLERMATEASQPAEAANAAEREALHADLVQGLRDRIAACTVRAPRDGFVTQVAPDAKRGAYLAVGDPILHVQALDYEIEAWVEARALDRSGIRNREDVDVRYLRDQKSLTTGVVVEVDTAAASREAIPDVLTDRAGGPIRLTMVGGEEQPDRAYIRVRIQPEDQPPWPALGSRVDIRFRGRVQSLAGWIGQQGRSLLQQWRLSDSR